MPSSIITESFISDVDIHSCFRKSKVVIICLEITLPLFGFEDHTEYTDYSLVANKCKSAITKTNNSGGLFGNTTDKETVITYLIPELKKVDYFLKIQSDFDNLGTKMLINEINDIKQIISAYQVEPETLKSKDNLIFD